MRTHPTGDAETFILPGLTGSGEGHWQWHWARDNQNAVFVEQDDWTCPRLADWRDNLEAALDGSDGAWIVAHSLGCLLTANMVRSPHVKKIRGALLVAPCDLVATEALHPCVLKFGDMPLDPLPFPSLVVASLNDPYMSFDKVKAVAGSWKSALIDIGAAGHVNIGSGFGRWTGGYDLLDLLRNASRHRATPNRTPTEIRFRPAPETTTH